MSGNDFMKKSFKVGGYTKPDKDTCARCRKEITTAMYRVKGRKLHQACYHKEQACAK